MLTICNYKFRVDASCSLVIPAGSCNNEDNNIIISF